MKMEAMPQIFTKDSVFRRESLKSYRDGYAIAATERAEGEREAMIRVAKKMKAKGSSLEEISFLTDLPISDIQTL